MNEDAGVTGAGRSSGVPAGTPPGAAPEDTALSSDLPVAPEGWATEPTDRERPAAPGLRVGRLLGRGGSSAVWLVTDDDGRRFALKVVTPDDPVPAEQQAARRSAEEQVVVPSAPPTRRARRVASGAAPVAPGPAAVGPATPAPAAASGVERGTGGGTGAGAGGADTGVTGAPDPGVLARELRLLQRFTHDHLVPVHGIIGTDQGPGLLMDLAPGGSLLGLVTTRGPLPVPEVVTALVPVAQALGYLHAAGALHGDVTPGNILFTAEGKPLLADFGTGRLLGSARGGVTGTPGFLDPLHDGSFEPGGDVFALAAVAWFALTGRVPGPAEQRPPLVLIVPEAPLELMQLVEDALSSDRHRRPTADDFARGLLAGSMPVPVDLVPAVHASVLPDLLTRRTEAPAGDPPSRGRRMTGRRSRAHGGVPGGRDAGRAGRPSAGTSQPERVRRGRRGDVRPRRGRRRDAGLPPVSRRATLLHGQQVGPARRDRQARVVVAALAGVAAVVLLVAGMVLTVDGFRSEPAAGHAPDSPSVTTAGAPDGSPSVAGPDPATPGPSDRTARAGTEPSDRDDASGEGAAGGADPDRAARADDPAVALENLAALRAQAFAEADPDLLARVDVEGSPAMATDHEAVSALAGTGRTLRNLSISIRDPVALTDAALAGLPALANLPVVAEPPPGTSVSVVRAKAVLSSYTETAAAPASQQPGSTTPRDATRQDLVFVLWTSGEGWRIHSVVAPPD
ncbi:protein kinase domain-containing protein [Arthrobacter pityocampae]|uniref:protein kinase domain-containing protein n=1 Tax=Arthrobacter pityocampae TaxID=547334 RepID=UPI003734EA4B